MGKMFELELSWWEITFWPDHSKNKRYTAKVYWRLGDMRQSAEEKFKTFEQAKAWIDAELAE